MVVVGQWKLNVKNNKNNFTHTLWVKKKKAVYLSANEAYTLPKKA